MSYTHDTPFLTMDDKWYDSREKTRSYHKACISSMEKENDEHKMRDNKKLQIKFYSLLEFL